LFKNDKQLPLIPKHNAMDLHFQGSQTEPSYQVVAEAPEPTAHVMYLLLEESLDQGAEYMDDSLRELDQSFEPRNNNASSTKALTRESTISDSFCAE
jgi:hypothetical protein